MRILTTIAILRAFMVAFLIINFAHGPVFADQVVGVPLIGASNAANVQLLTPGSDTAFAQAADEVGQPFTDSLRVTTKKATVDPWDVQVSIPTNAPVSKGDTISFSFYIRRIDPVAGYVNAGADFELSQPPYTKSLNVVLMPTLNWQRVDLPFRSVANYAPGSAHVHVLLGYSAGVVDLAGFSLIDYGSSVDPDSLPHFHITYPGEEPDASWRAAAEARISLYREAGVSIKVEDSSGKPVVGAAVHVKMVRPSFDFGTAVTDRYLAGNTSDDQTYQSDVASLFTKATIENELKWKDWSANPSDQQNSIAMVDWLDGHDIAVRGHNLVWPSWENSPPVIRSDYYTHLASDGGEGAKQWLESAVEQHITEEASALRGKVVSWDVVNEPVTNHDMTDILGNGAMANWFKAAHEADPGARLYLNDFNDFYGRAKPGDIDKLHRILQTLIAEGAPIGGIGLESHFNGLIATPDEVLRSLKDFSKFGLPIEITEYDFKTTDPVLQADYTRDFLTMCYSWPAVQSFVMWGFWDGSHWLGDAPLFNRDWSLKPSGKAFEDLVYHHWWTDTSESTPRGGVVKTRAFLGAYTICVTSGARTKTENMTVHQGSNTLTVTI